MGICFESNNKSQHRISKRSKRFNNENDLGKSLSNNIGNNNNNSKNQSLQLEQIKDGKIIIKSGEINDEMGQLNLLNKPLENLSNSVNSVFSIDSKKTNTYDNLIIIYKKNIGLFPFNNLSLQDIDQYIKDYTSSNMEAPYKFIESKNHSLLFTKISNICFLKCEPLLNNINDFKNITNLIFLRILIILLIEKNIYNIIYEIFETITQSSFDNERRCFNKLKIESGIKNFCEICYQIIFYFILGINEFTEEQYINFLSNDNILIENKYNKITFDEFCLNKYLGKNTITKMNEITTQWTEFICKDIEEINEYQSYRNFDNINEKIIGNNIKTRFAFMCCAANLLKIIGGFKLPEKDD